MEKINWGIIGLGNVAHKFSEAFKDIKNSKLLAAASKDKNKLNIFKEKYNFEDKFFVGETKKMDFYISLISSKIENISFFSNSQKRKGISYLKLITDKIDSFPTIITNKDFKAHNILSDGNEMYVVDWEMVDHNSYIFWMPCAFIRTLSYDFFRSYFHNKKFGALENYFMSKYLELTPLKNLKNYLPLSSFFDLVIALSESPESINKEYPRGALIASIRRYNKLING